MSNNTRDKRKWDKLQACIFCKELVRPYARHLLRKHKFEIEVQKLSSLTKGSLERKRCIEKLRKAGNYAHNNKVLRANSGQIIPVKRAASSKTVENYYPCHKCFGLYLKRQLWRHECNFKAVNDGPKLQGRLQTYNSLLLDVPNTASQELRDNIISKMKPDLITLIIKNDPLILLFGTKLFNKLGHLRHLWSHISQKMREIARLVQAVRKRDENVIFLADSIHVSKFDCVVECVKEVAGFTPETKRMTIPSLALKIGHTIKKCCVILKSEAIKKLDVDGEMKADSFLNLCNAEWGGEVSCHALKSLDENKWNKLQILPLAEDIVKINKVINTDLAAAKKELQRKVTMKNWDILSKAALSSMILFNRKRSGEASRMKIKIYESRDRDPNSQTEIQKSLSDYERKLCNGLTLVELRGKKGRKIPILLTKDMKESIDLIIKHRIEVGVNEANEHVFPRRNCDSLESLRGSDVLRFYAQICGAKSPHLLTSTRLRKHVGTMSQLLNLKEHELDCLANFLGHDIRIHREFYRLPESTMYMAKISKILIAMESGTAHKFKGKSLDEMDIQELYVSDEDEVKQKNTKKNKAKKVTGNADSENIDKLTVTSRSCVRNKRINLTNKPAESSSESESDESEEPEYKTRNKSCKRVPWTNVERNAVMKSLGTFIALRKVPGKKSCIECIDESGGVLKNRTWSVVKSFIHSRIQTINRQAKNQQ